MASLNRQELIGRLGKDVEVKKGQNGNGTAYCFISVATDDYVGKGADGKAKTETTWHDITVFGQTAEYLGKYAKKGTMVYVEGRTEHKKDDKEVWRTRVIATQVIITSEGSNGNGNSNGASEQSSQSDRGARSAATTQQQAAPAAAAPAAVQQAVAAGPASADDDLPF